MTDCIIPPGMVALFKAIIKFMLGVIAFKTAFF